MPKLEEFTQNSKNPKTGSSYWEESLPLPEFGVLQAQTEKQVTPQTQAPPKTQAFVKKRWFILNIRIGLFFGAVVTLLVLGSLAGVFLNQKVQNEKTKKPTAQTVRTTLRRISSAFVPKNPSTEPARLWVNWQNFQDEDSGLSFFHPEEWGVTKDGGEILYTVYYPSSIDLATNLEEEFLAKLTINVQPATSNLAEFLLKRYNLSSANFRRENFGENQKIKFEFSNTFVFATNSENNFYILEGKAKNISDFENFLPIFDNIVQTFQVF